MFRPSGLLLSRENKTYNRYSDASMLDLSIGGLNGHRAELGLAMASADYIRSGGSLICRVLRLPRAFEKIPNGAGLKLGMALKQICETYAQGWEGFNASKRIATTDTPISGTSEIFQSPTKVIRERSSPSLRIPEKQGLAVYNVFDTWTDLTIGDYDTQIPNIFTIEGVAREELLPDFYSMCCLFYEVDRSFQYVLRAYLIDNMFPMDGLENIAWRDKTREGEKTELTIPFAGYQDTSLGAKRLAQKLHNRMSLTGTNSNLQSSYFDDIDAYVKATGVGYEELLNYGRSRAISESPSIIA